MRFSLIVATLGRVEELRALFESMALQSYSDFEVVVVDQNLDDRLSWIEEPGSYSFARSRIKSNVRHLSHARNIGLQACVGEIVAFPDDDCLYPPLLLEVVNRAFLDQADLGIRTGPAVTADGGFSSMRWQTHPGTISIGNVWHCAIAFNIFIRRDLVTMIGGFDEKLGVGGVFGSGEETDLVLRALQTGSLGWYDVAQVVMHPDKGVSPQAAKRAFAYGAGFGYVLRKHDFPARIWLVFMLRSISGCVVNLVLGRMVSAKYYWRTLCGRVYGFAAYRRSAELRGGELATAARVP